MLVVFLSILLLPGLEFDDDQLLLGLSEGFVLESQKVLMSLGTLCKRNVILYMASKHLLVMP